MPQVQTPILGGFYQSRTLLAADQRCINLYPEIVETKDGKAVGALYGCPGLDSLGTLGTGPWRALRALNDGLFGVSGSAFYQITASFNGLQLGVLGSNKVPVGMVDNGKQLLLVDGAAAYGYDIGSNHFAPIALPFVAGFPVVCAYQDGFFLLNQAGTQNWWQSNLNDVFTWDPLDFSEKDGQPDNIVAIVDNHREVWLLGAQTTEVWINAGLPGFAFQRLQGVFIQEGCAAPYSAIVVGGSVIWLSKSREGQGVVLQARGYQAVRISTHAIEREIQGYDRIDDALAYAYQQEGHLFYVLNFPAADTTWCFDTTTGYWHQRAGFDNGEFVRHRGNCCALFQGGNIVGDFATGDLYQFNLNTYDDAGRTRKWLRSWQAFPPNRFTLKKTRLNRLQIYMEPGVGSDSPPAIRVIELPAPGFVPPVQPKLTIVKTAIGGDASFPFVITNAFPATATLVTVGGTRTFELSALIGAIPSITETVPAGWTLTSTTVTNARPGSPPFILGTTALQAGDDVTVTFTDTINAPPPPRQLPPGGPPITCPSGTVITAYLQAGGGGGQDGLSDENSGAGGGAGEYRVVTITSTGAPISYSIGAGGAHGDPGGNGGDTVFGSFTVLGGQGGQTAFGDHTNSFGPGGANASGTGGGNNSSIGTNDWSGANGGFQQNTSGGAGGGAASNGGNSIVAYSGSPPVLGGVKGTFITPDDGDSGVGGGGAASPFGSGGKGGDSDPTNGPFGVAHPGASPAGTSYGAGGGGGACTSNAQANGADGAIGCIFLVGSGGCSIPPPPLMLYVVNEIDNSVSPVNLSTNVAGTAIPVDLTPNDIALTPDGKTLYVVNQGSNTVTPITVATNVAGTPIVVGNTPVTIAITPDGATAYVVNTNDDTVTPITIATNTAGTPIAVGSKPQNLVITSDGAKVYVVNGRSASVTPITVASNTAGTPIAVGTNPFAIAITPNGHTAYVSSEVDETVVPITLSTNTPGTPIPVGIGLGADPIQILITPDGQTAYVVSEGDASVTPITIATNVAGSPIPIGTAWGTEGLTFPAAMTPDGSMLYVANQSDNTVIPITVATNTAGAAINVGASPVSVIITPDGTMAYVSNLQDGTLTPINTTTKAPGAPITVGIFPNRMVIVEP